MADSFLFNVAESVLGKLGCLALQEFSLAWGLESDLEKIKDNLKVIKAVLLDAEQQRSQNPQIEVWLENLKEVLYDAEDVVDEFECEVLRRQVVKSGNTTRKVRRFFSRSNPLTFRFRMGHKLKQIRETVDEVAALKSKFGLTERIFYRNINHGERQMTHSFIDASNVIGREQARNDIIETIATHFELKLWVCVSDVFELDEVIIKVLDSASTGQRYTDMDYIMDDIELVYLWMANGLVQCSNENQELEDIGFRYFKELCSRCFFQDFAEYGGVVKCKMHDLIHDLALSVTQNECSMENVLKKGKKNFCFDIYSRRARDEHAGMEYLIGGSYESTEENKEWLERSAVATLMNIHTVSNLETYFSAEGVFSINVSPMGVDLDRVRFQVMLVEEAPSCSVPQFCNKKLVNSSLSEETCRRGYGGTIIA
ncbi:hypothetical protein GH714_033094 [Hevea brasiliensis]|uniref:Uncharacterized protein n=1 Tax=Hevea brasiliensis TaxID=3981 RepID=A0A6A6M6J6_HEVBR|nr:hypothetical protein GH714_033094 [Hevea brasiliensis]